MRTLTKAEKKHVLANKHLWPTCQNPECGKKISPNTKKRSDGTIPWALWARSKYCDCKCAASHNKIKYATPNNKKCKDCGAVFWRTTENNKQWRIRSRCDSHAQTTKSIKEMFREGRVCSCGDSEGAPIKPGFYIFSMERDRVSEPKL